MRRAWIVLVCLCCLTAFMGSARAEESGNLLRNGGFEEAEDGWPLYWAKDMWRFDEGVSYLELREEGHGGEYCIRVENADTNDARVVQTVAVEAETLYRLFGYVKAEGCDPDYAGASLSVIGTYLEFPEAHDTDGEWVPLECYIKTVEGQTEIVIGARLGDYGADNVGKAWFDDLSLTKAEELPAEAYFVQLRDYSWRDGYAEPEAETAAASQTGNDISQVLWLALFAALVLALLSLRARSVRLPRGTIWVLLLAAAAVRLFLMATQPGYETDMNCFYSWSFTMAEVGPGAFYETVSWCDYTPGYMYPLWLTGGLLNLFGLNGQSHDVIWVRMVVKIIPLLADLSSIYLLYRLARKKLSETPALLLALLYAFSPAVLIDGAVWGQVDSVVALGLLGTLAFATEKKWRWAIPVFVVTVLMKPQALLAGPVGLMALVLDCARRPEAEARKEDEEARPPAFNTKPLRDALIGLGIAVGIAAAMLLPFLVTKEQPISWLLNLYGGTMGSYSHAVLNAPNLYYLLGANWVPLGEMIGPISYGTLGTITMVLAIVLVLALFVRRRDNAWLPYFCAMMYIGIFLFGPMMHERYLFPALLLLLYAYIQKRDARILVMFVGFSCTFFVNCALVLRDLHLPLGHGFLATVLSVLNLLLFGLGVWVAVDKRERPLPAPPPPPSLETRRGRRQRALEGKTTPGFALKKKDWMAMLSLTMVYGAIAYVGLGSTVAPQTTWTSTGAPEVVTVDLGSVQDFNVLYYGGINHRNHVFWVEFSDDGEGWSEAAAARLYPGNCFQWQLMSQAVFDGEGRPQEWANVPLIYSGRYVQVVFETPAAALMEIVFRDLEGNVIEPVAVSVSGERAESAYAPALLFDEGDTAPEYPSYYNGTYFDEIYHARTAYEHANGMMTYEWTHPPLGKVLMMLSVKVFGMTPFGWRFMGALMGVLMVPAMYLMGKLLFRKTKFAFLAAFVMAFDMMHLTQTRIATIDSYAVLFIILMYLCMFYYMRMSVFRDGMKTLIPLGLSGLFMGLGCASKWICMYAAVGLAVLFFWTVAQRFLEWKAGMASEDEAVRERVARFPRQMGITLAGCVGFFLVIPAAIYYFSYIPHFAWEGGLTFTRFWNEQIRIFGYHSTLVDDHAFKSPWYEWPLMLKPMYYYSGKPHVPAGLVSTIMCMGNPAVWYAGLAGLGYIFYRFLRPHLRGEYVEDHRPALLLVSFAAQFVPWMLVPRSTFIYHYFGSLPFVMMCLVYLSERLHAWKPARAKVIQNVYMGVVLLMFIAFYPVATGVPVPEVWIKSVNWLGFLKLPGWKFKGWIYY